jgi:uncharacterized membrane protein YedE/YeeE
MTFVTAAHAQAVPMRPESGVQVRVVAWACVGVVVLGALAGMYGADCRVPALALVGAGIGFVLLQAQFGFAGSFRAALERRDFAGFRAQAVALAVSTILFFPLLGMAGRLGLPLHGFVAGIGVSFAVGAVLFGIGMQIGGGCASGTLFALGGGNGALLVTLVFFVLGSALGAADLGRWDGLPALPALTSQDVLGWPVAMVAHLAIFAALIRYLPGGTAVEPAWPALRAALFRPWPLLLGAWALALLNAITLLLAYHPWGETSGFTLWGSKLALRLGFHPAAWPYWEGQGATLGGSVFSDITSVMDCGIILGAALAAGLSGRFRLRVDLGVRELLGAALGGVLMGYGARLSGGCNIGAYFSALASGSLSGWAWVGFAFVGSWIGVRLRFVLGRG